MDHSNEWLFTQAHILGMRGMIMATGTTRFSTVPEVAIMLRVSRMTIYRLVSDGGLPSVRVGKLIRIPTASVWRFLSDCDIDPEDAGYERDLEKE